MRNKKGFTLIEMLVVIAIIAVLVAVIVPTVSSSTTKAKAAADAANLHTVYGIANSALVGNDTESAMTEIRQYQIECESFPDAEMWIAYTEPAFVKIYFVDGDNYYDVDYFSDVASKGESTRSTVKPQFSNAEWYKITV